MVNNHKCKVVSCGVVELLRSKMKEELSESRLEVFHGYFGLEALLSLVSKGNN